MSKENKEGDLKKSNRRIKSKGYYPGSDISRDVKNLNKDEDLIDELGNFRLASVHKDLGLNSQASNVVLVNLRIKFITKTDVKVKHVIPVSITQNKGKEFLTCYSGANIDEDDFLKFYQSVNKGVKSIDRINHYHSEPFLVYYLCSEEGQNFLKKQFKMKDLIVRGEEKNSRGSWPLISNVKEIAGIGLDFHSTKVVCYNCSQFLRDATPKLLDVIYRNLSLRNLPKEKRLENINFNVSANQNFNWKNISKTKTFDHIPVLENKKNNILTNTEEKIGDKESKLQKTGEASNRTYFLSGSYTTDDEVIKFRKLDQENWQKLCHEAAINIQRIYREYYLRNL